MYPSSTTHTALPPPEGCWIVHLAGMIITEKTSINLYQNSMGKVEGGCFCRYFSLLEKKGGSYLSCTGVKGAGSFCLLPQPKQQRTVVGRGLHFGGVHVLVTSCWGNSWAKLMCCYRSARRHKRASADHGVPYTDGSSSVCIKVMVHNSFPISFWTHALPKMPLLNLPRFTVQSTLWMSRRGEEAQLWGLILKQPDFGTSLVAQWLRIRLPMQGTRVRALVREDPTCRGATKPVHHNYWAYEPQLLSPCA